MNMVRRTGSLGLLLAAALVQGQEMPLSVVEQPDQLDGVPVSSNALRVTWHDYARNESGTRIERRGGPNGMWARIATVGSNVTSFLDTGLSPATWYEYRVHAFSPEARSGHSETSAHPTPAGRDRVQVFHRAGWPGHARGGGTGVFVFRDFAFVTVGPGGLLVYEVRDPLHPRLVGGFTTEGSASAVHVSGDYAYVAVRGLGLAVLDVSDPSTPTQVGTCPTRGRQAQDVDVAWPYAYVADGAYGVAVVDVRDPSRPTAVAATNTAGEARGVRAAGEHVFVADHSAGLTVIAVSTPANPVIVASVDTPGFAGGVHVADGRAYVADDSGGLRIFDVSSPTNVAFVGACPVADAVRVHAYRDHAYVACGYGGVSVVDVSVATNPVLSARHATPTGVAAEDAFAHGQFAYVAAGVGLGLEILDVTEATNPVPVAARDTGGNAKAVSVRGHLAFVADGRSGLRILSVTNPAAPALAGECDLPGESLDLAVESDLVFVASYGGGLQIVNVASAAMPRVVGAYETNGLFTAVTVDSGFAYVGFEGPMGNGLAILDVSDPTHVAYLGDLVTGVMPINDIAVDGAYAFVAQGGGLWAVDVGDPANPRGVGRSDAILDVYGVQVGSGCAYLASGLDGLLIVDVSDPTARPFPLIGQIATPGDAMSVQVVDGWALVACATAGVEVVDVADPTTPALLGSYDTGGDALGVLNALPFVYVSDGAAGMQVLETVVSNPVASASDGAWLHKVRVRWLGVSGAGACEVWRADTDRTNAASMIAGGLTGSSFDDTNAVQGRTYYYWVRAQNGPGAGRWSVPDAGYAKSFTTLDADGPGAGGRIRFGGQTDWYRVPIAAADSYVIESSLGTLSDNYLFLYGPDSHTLEITRSDDSRDGNAARIAHSLTPGAHYLKHRAYSVLQTGTYGIRVITAPALAPSSLVARAASPSRVELRWVDVSDKESGFRVERSAAPVTSWREIGSARANATNFTDDGVLKGCRYTYRVRATNDNGASMYSAPAEAVTPNPPDAPSDLRKRVASPTRIELGWADRATNEAGTVVERKAGIYGVWRHRADLGANATNFADAGLAPGPAYYYRIRAHNADGWSDYVYEAGVNGLPIVCASTQTIALSSLGDMAVLDASCSYDPDGDPLVFSWREMPGNPAHGLVPVAGGAMNRLHIHFPSPGRYEFEVRVSDGLDMSLETRRFAVDVPGLSGVIDVDTSEGFARVADVRVSAHASMADANTNGPALDVSVSDSFGEYRLLGLASDRGAAAPARFVRLQRAGFETRIKEVLVPGGASSAQGRHSLSRGLRRKAVTGRILRPDGAPAIGGSVSIVGLANGECSGGVDWAGRFLFIPVPYGSASFQIMIPGHRPEVRDVYIGPGLGPLTFHLEPGELATADLTVRVAMAGVDQPVEGARVSLGSGLTGTTDPWGVCRFRSLVPGAYIVTVVSADFHAMRLPYVDVAGGSSSLDVPLTPVRGFVLSGTVTDRRSDRPVPLAKVGIETAAGLIAIHCVSDPTGYFHLAGVPAGTQRVRAEASGYRVWTADVRADRDLTRDVALERAVNWRAPDKTAGANAPVARLRAAEIFMTNLLQEAVLDGSPSLGTDLRYVWREGPNNPEFGFVPQGSETVSRIRVAGIRIPGVYVFELQVTNGTGRSRNTAVTAVFAPGLAGNVHLSPSDGVYGLAQAEVRAYRQYADAARWDPATLVDSALTSADPPGDFVLSGLGPGRFWIAARPTVPAGCVGYGPVCHPVNYSSASRRLMVNIARPEYDYHGYVVDRARRRPVEGVRVVISEGSLAETFRTSTDERGYFRLPSIPSGQGRVVMFIRQGYRSLVRSASVFRSAPPDWNALEDRMGAADARDVSVRAQSQVLEEDPVTVRVSGFIRTDYKGIALPVPRAEVVLGGGFARTFADANGYYEVQGIPRGAYFGIVRCAGYRTASMTDSAFGSLQLTNAVNRVDRLLRFKGRGPVVRGIVVGPAGEPLAHSAVSIVADAVKGVAPLSAAALARPAEGEVLRTGADGVFQLVGVPYGECRIRVECGGQVRTNVVHVAGDQQTVFPWTPPSSDPPFAEWLARFFPRDPPADPSVAGPNADPDHDGASNTNEFLCGTDPTNGARSLRMGSLSRKGSGELAVRWASAEGCFYRLLRSTNLKTGFVEELASDVAATPPQNTFEDTAPPSNAPCFYRVDLDPER